MCKTDPKDVPIPEEVVISEDEEIHLDVTCDGDSGIDNPRDHEDK